MANDSQNITKYFKPITSLRVNKGKNNYRDRKKKKKTTTSIPYFWYTFLFFFKLLKFIASFQWQGSSNTAFRQACFRFYGNSSNICFLELGENLYCVAHPRVNTCKCNSVARHHTNVYTSCNLILRSTERNWFYLFNSTHPVAITYALLMHSGNKKTEKKYW
jgi:hypothetical protein